MSETPAEFTDHVPDPSKMSREEASGKGELIKDHIANIWSLIEWEEREEMGDPYIKVTLYKSGRFTVENYADDELAEFQINDEAEIE